MKKTFLPLLILSSLFVLAPALAADGVTPTATTVREHRLVHVESQYDMAMYSPTAAALSFNGENVYVADNMDNSVVVFSRDAATGALTYLEKHIDGVDANGLDGARDVVVSPDGENVYAISYIDNALVTFNRHAVSGALTYDSQIVDGDGGIVDGLFGPYGIAINPLGTAVFVASYGEDALAVFTRDTTTGDLTFLQVFFDGVGVNGLDHATSVAVSPDNKHVYVGGNDDDAVAIFSWDEDFQWLTYRGYVMNGAGTVEGLYGPNRIALDPTGAHLYVACQGDTLVVFERDSTAGALTYVEYHRDGVDDVDGIDAANWVSVSPDGDHVYVAGRNDQAVAIFSRDEENGELEYEGMVQSGVDGVRDLAAISSVIVSPGSGDHLYATGRNSMAIVAFDRDPASGALTFQKSYHNGEGLDGAIGVALSHDGRYVYTTGNNEDALTVFERDTNTGKLTYSQSIVDRYDIYFQEEARSVAVSPDDRHIYVAGFGDDAISIYERDAETGRLTNIGYIVDGDDGVTLNGPQSITMSPAGDLLYAATAPGNALVIFDRDIETGGLDINQTATDGAGSMNSLGGAYAVGLSSDGSSVYVAAYDDDAVSVFYWFEGNLYYEGAVINGEDEVDGLDGANDVVVSPDDRYVYVASRKDNAVAYFWRNPSNGTLNYQGMVEHGDGGANWMTGPRALAVSPDGLYLYVVSQYASSVTVFQRDIATGALTHVGHRYRYEDDLFGLHTANGIALSRGGNFLYVTGYDNDAIVVFRTQFPLYLPYINR